MQKRNQRIEIRVSYLERSAIELNAEKAGLSVPRVGRKSVAALHSLRSPLRWVFRFDAIALRGTLRQCFGAKPCMVQLAPLFNGL